MTVKRGALLAILLAIPIAIVAYVALSGDGSDETAATEGTRDFYTAVRAMSGDSLEVFLPERTAVAILGVKAPAGGTLCGERARAFVAELVVDGVTLEGTRPPQSDENDRRLYQAFTLDGRNIGLLLVEEGLAEASDLPHRLQTAFTEAERAAQTEGRGCVWSLS